MNKSQICEKLAYRACIDVEIVEGLFDDFRELCEDALSKGDCILLSGLFSMKASKPKKGGIASAKALRVSVSKSKRLERKVNELYEQKDKG